VLCIGALPFVFRTFGILYGIIAIFFIGYLSHLGTVYLLKCKDITKK
jgi:amino acid permease